MAIFSNDVRRRFIGLILIMCGTLGYIMASTGCPHWDYTDSGVITSPYYPQNYLDNTYCEWVIRVPTGKRIKVDFTVFHTETCCDHLEIFHGPSTAYPAIGNFSGNSTPSGFRSQSNALTFVFKTDSSVNYQGFRLTYLFYTQVSSVAIGKNAIQTDSASGAGPDLAVDGWVDTCSTTKSVNAEWKLDLTDYYLIEEVTIHPASVTKSYTIEMGLGLGKYEAVYTLSVSASSLATWRPTSKGPYRHIRIKANPQNQQLTICELQIKGSPQPRTPPFLVFTGIGMSKPPFRTVSSVVCQIECSSICLLQSIPACVVAQYDQARKSCSLFDGCEHTEYLSNSNKTIVLAFAANCFTK